MNEAQEKTPKHDYEYHITYGTGDWYHTLSSHPLEHTYSKDGNIATCVECGQKVTKILKA